MIVQLQKCVRGRRRVECQKLDIEEKGGRMRRIFMCLNFEIFKD
jgi:hypothetical protein